MVVLSDNTRNIKWAELLGFSRENNVAKYFTPDKRDVIRYEFVDHRML